MDENKLRELRETQNGAMIFNYACGDTTESYTHPGVPQLTLYPLAHFYGCKLG